MAKEQGVSHEEQQTTERRRNTLHVDNGVRRRASTANPSFAEINNSANAATDNEHNMTFQQAVKLYPKAAGWSVLLSTALVMEGYDIVLLANFYALPQFNQKFGELQPSGDYVISAPWKSGLSNGALVGEILGLFVTGIIQDRYGFKKTIGSALILMICFIFIVFFAQNIVMLLVGEILCGIPWGVFQTITTAYASEVCPVILRPYLTTYVNLCWVMGQFIGSGVLRAMVDRNDQWAYKIPFAIQWIWPVPILIGCTLCPESPWWLVRKGRIEDAKHSLRRLTTRGDETFDPDQTVAMMEHTNEIEKVVNEGTQYWDCFKGTDLRRTEIVCFTWLVQTICGSTFMGYSTFFYVQAGLPTTSSFDLSMGQYALGMVGTIGSWFLMGYLGRRSIYLYGSCALFGLLLIIGFTSLAPSGNERAEWAIGSMLLIFTFVYDLTVGPVCYSLVAELSSTRLKAKTIVLARNLYNVGGIVVNIITNYQLTETAWNWGAKSGFFWAGTCFICVVWIYFRLPEPKGRTYGELDVLFEQKVSARKFHKTLVDFEGDGVDANMGSPAEFNVTSEPVNGKKHDEKITVV